MCAGASLARKRCHTQLKRSTFWRFYIVAEDAWYVLPVAVVAVRTRLYFVPSGSKRGGVYEKYREAWDLMKAEPSAPGP
jgi:hypothetical protein